MDSQPDKAHINNDTDRPGRQMEDTVADGQRLIGELKRTAEALERRFAAGLEEGADPASQVYDMSPRQILTIIRDAMNDGLDRMEQIRSASKMQSEGPRLDRGLDQSELDVIRSEGPKLDRGLDQSEVDDGIRSEGPKLDRALDQSELDGIQPRSPRLESGLERSELGGTQSGSAVHDQRLRQNERDDEVEQRRLIVESTSKQTTPSQRPCQHEGQEDVDENISTRRTRRPEGCQEPERRRDMEDDVQWTGSNLQQRPRASETESPRHRQERLISIGRAAEEMEASERDLRRDVGPPEDRYKGLVAEFGTLGPVERLERSHAAGTTLCQDDLEVPTKSQRAIASRILDLVKRKRRSEEIPAESPRTSKKPRLASSSPAVGSERNEQSPWDSFLTQLEAGASSPSHDQQISSRQSETPGTTKVGFPGPVYPGGAPTGKPYDGVIIYDLTNDSDDEHSSTDARPSGEKAGQGSPELGETSPRPVFGSSGKSVAESPRTTDRSPSASLPSPRRDPNLAEKISKCIEKPDDWTPHLEARFRELFQQWTTGKLAVGTNMLEVQKALDDHVVGTEKRNFTSNKACLRSLMARHQPRVSGSAVHRGQCSRHKNLKVEKDPWCMYLTFREGVDRDTPFDGRPKLRWVLNFRPTKDDLGA